LQADQYHYQQLSELPLVAVDADLELPEPNAQEFEAADSRSNSGQKPTENIERWQHGQGKTST
jgi:hypothetical protein